MKLEKRESGLLVIPSREEEEKRRQQERENIATLDKQYRNELITRAIGPSRLLEQFNQLPNAEQQIVMNLLKQMLMRRGGGGIFATDGKRRNNPIDAIADVFTRNGMEQEEYT